MVAGSERRHPSSAPDLLDTPLLARLRKNTGTGKMPSNSTLRFQPHDVEVLETWIGNGAKNG